MEMTVIDARAELIAYYERRGYARTGERFIQLRRAQRQGCGVQCHGFLSFPPLWALAAER